MQTDSVETNSWQAASLATLLRDTLRLHGGENDGDVTVPADAASAIMSGLYRLAELTKAVARAEV